MIANEHELICGRTRMGKSFWVLYRIFQSFKANVPCCYIDPKGDTYRSLLAFLSSTKDGRKVWEAYKHRILFLNPVSRSDQILGFNALEAIPELPSSQPDRVALLANSITSHIRKQSGLEVGDAVRMQNIMNGSIGLLSHDSRFTLAEIPLLFVSTQGDKLNPFVRQLLPLVEHLGTVSFWKDQFTHWDNTARREWPQSTLGRIFQFNFDERTLFTLCTTRNARLDFRKVVDQGFWLFVNLPQSQLTEAGTTVLGNFIISKFFLACMRYMEQSKPYRLILDEARLFNSGPLDQILEMSLGANLSLTLVVQDLEQLARHRDGFIDKHLMDTALNNARYIEVFQDFTDREILAKMMYPVQMKQIGTRMSGDPDYQHPQVTMNENERRFTELGPRQMIFWDKETQTPFYGRTPDVVMDRVDPARIDLFEAQHLQLTGVPARAIKDEIRERQEWVRRLFDTPTRQHFGRDA